MHARAVTTFTPGTQRTEGARNVIHSYIRAFQKLCAYCPLATHLSLAPRSPSLLSFLPCTALFPTSLTQCSSEEPKFTFHTYLTKTTRGLTPLYSCSPILVLGLSYLICIRCSFDKRAEIQFPHYLTKTTRGLTPLYS
jgi:hypothetical protein